MNATGLRTLTASSPFARCDNDHNAETSGLIEAQGSYRVRLASSEADRLAAFRLRFLVFNLELDEGLMRPTRPATTPTTSTRSVTTSSSNIQAQARSLGPTGYRPAWWLPPMLVTTANVNSTSHPTSA